MPMRHGGGSLVPTDLISGENYPVVKVAFGATGVLDAVVSETNPLPVTNAGSAIAEGLDSVRSDGSIFGGNVDIDAAAAEDLIDYGGTLVETIAGVPAVVGLSSSSANDVLYAGTLTFTANAKDTETVTINGKVYTFQSVLTDADGHVQLGGSASDSLDYLIAAINLAAGAGAFYAASTTGQTGISAVAGAGDTLTLYTTSAVATVDGMGASAAWGAATTVAGTGAQTVTIYGLDENGDLQSETINMRGITLTDSVGTYSFIYRAEVTTAGSGLTNAGIISITDSPLTEYFAQILTGNSQTLMAVYMVPTNYELYIDGVSFAFGTPIPAGADVACDLVAKPTGGSYLLKHRLGLSVSAPVSADHTFTVPLKFPAGTIVKLRGTTDTNNTLLYGGWSGYLKAL